MTPQRTIWTLGGVVYLIGLVISLTVFGVLADQQYNIIAATGVPLSARPPIQTVSRPGVPPTPTQVQPTMTQMQPTAIAPSFTIPDLNREQPSPVPASEPWTSTITRIHAPAINLDKQVVPVQWTAEVQDGQDVAVFAVDRYRVGHHQGSRNPGGGGNIVLAGHSGGRAYPFNDIFYLKPGDRIELWSQNQVYAYVVSAHIVVDEVGQPLAKRLENARYIQAADEELVTMVACWPLTGKDKFTQRVIIQAKPVVVPVFDADVSPIQPR